MHISVSVKQLGKRKALLTESTRDIPPSATLRELITNVVQAETAAYNAKPPAGPDGGDNAPPPLAFLLTTENITDKAPTGKIDFGLRRNRKEDPDAAVARALTAFEDGMYRVFVGELELENLDQLVNLHPGDRLTFIRLTMLTGR